MTKVQKENGLSSSFVGSENPAYTHQGHSTVTILTNKSRNETVIRPFCKNKAIRAPSFAKGTRWMHRTTFKLEEKPVRNEYVSSTGEAHSGKNLNSRPQRPIKCPTLHKSHFDIGVDGQQSHITHYDAEYPFRNIQHPNKVHYPSLVNWSHNVTGQDMRDVLSRPYHQPNYWSSYAGVHSKLGLERGEGASREPLPKTQYDILTGEDKCYSASNSHLTSGNRVLYSGRRGAEDGFILG